MFVSFFCVFFSTNKKTCDAFMQQQGFLDIKNMFFVPNRRFISYKFFVLNILLSLIFLCALAP